MERGIVTDISALMLPGTEMTLHAQPGQNYNLSQEPAHSRRRRQVKGANLCQNEHQIISRQSQRRICGKQSPFWPKSMTNSGHIMEQSLLHIYLPC